MDSSPKNMMESAGLNRGREAFENASISVVKVVFSFSAKQHAEKVGPRHLEVGEVIQNDGRSHVITEVFPTDGGGVTYHTVAS